MFKQLPGTHELGCLLQGGQEKSMYGQLCDWQWQPLNPVKHSELLLKHAVFRLQIFIYMGETETA